MQAQNAQNGQEIDDPGGLSSGQEMDKNGQDETEMTRTAETSEGSRDSEGLKVDSEATDGILDDLEISITTVNTTTEPSGAAATPPALPPPLSPARRATVLLLLTSWAFVGNLSNTIIAPALPLIQMDLNTTQQAVNSSVTVMAVVNGVLPLFWAAASDSLGRRKVFLVAGPIMVLASAAGYFIPNIAVFYVIRIVQQTAASASLSTGSGTIADMYDRSRLSNALGIFYLGFTTGTTIGPALGGIVAEKAGWRFCFVLTAGLAVVVFGLVAAFLPETRSAASASEAGKDKDGNENASTAKPRRKSILALLHRSFVSLTYNKYPFILAVVLVMAFTFAELYAMTVTIPRDMPAIYGFSTSQAGFVQLATGASMLLGTYASGQFSDFTFKSWKFKRGGTVIPEDRLRATWPAILILVTGSLMLGWSLVTALSWIVSSLGACLTGFGLAGFSTAGSAYLIELFPGSASGIIASANVLRYTLAGIGPLIVAPMQGAVGPGWLWTFLCGLNVAAYSGMVVVMFRGTRYRLGMEPWKSYQNAAEQLSALDRGKKKRKQVEDAEVEESKADLEHQAVGKSKVVDGDVVEIEEN